VGHMKDNSTVILSAVFASMSIVLDSNLTALKFRLLATYAC